MISENSKPKPKSRDNILEEEEIINFIDFAKSYKEKILCYGLEGFVKLREGWA